MSPPGRAVGGLVVSALLVLGAGCSSVQKLSFPNPPVTTAPSRAAVPTLPDDLSSVSQSSVAGATTTTLPSIGPGAAVLNGSVFGPSGPIAGAVVQADRVVGDQTASTQVTTAADGSWRISHILGGVYRVRAWHAPNFDLTTPQVLFLGDAEDLTVSLELTAFPGPHVATSMAPSAPLVGRAAKLLVQVTTPTVAPDGVLGYQPVPGEQVQLTAYSGWSVSSQNPAATNAAGEAVFQVECQTAGLDPLIATVGANATPVSLQVPACSPAPAPTTSTTAPCISTTVAPPVDSTNTTPVFGTC